MNASPESETDAVVAATCAPLNAKVDEAVAIAPVIEKHSLSRQSHEVVVAIGGGTPAESQPASNAVWPTRPRRR